MFTFNLTRNLNRYSPTQKALFCSKTALYENQILLKWKSRITLQSMRKQCCGDWRPFSSIRISKYKTGLRCDRQHIWNQYLFTGKSEKKEEKPERFLSIPKHGNSKAKIWNTFRGQILGVFFVTQSTEETVQMRTIYQVAASHYCVTARMTSVLWLFRTSVSTTASNYTDGTSETLSPVGSTWEVPGSTDYADVRTVVDNHRDKTRQEIWCSCDHA
jgi:hypothetical protein